MNEQYNGQAFRPAQDFNHNVRNDEFIKNQHTRPNPGQQSAYCYDSNRNHQSNHSNCYLQEGQFSQRGYNGKPRSEHEPTQPEHYNHSDFEQRTSGSEQDCNYLPDVVAKSYRAFDHLPNPEPLPSDAQDLTTNQVRNC